MHKQKIILGILGTMLTTAIAMGDVPTTQPAPAASAGTTTAAPAANRADVYLLPFTSISGDSQLTWAGRAVQQNLLTDLARYQLHPLAADQSITPANAHSAARAAGAKYLITGTYQTTDQLLRFNGQIIDVASGNVVGGITATGAERDLFALEDSLSAQAIQQIARLTGVAINAPPANAIAPQPARPVPQALQPAAVAQAIQPPAAADGSNFDGSDLQSYVDANRTPSNDFNQQLDDANNRATYTPYANYGYSYPSYGYGYGYGYGGYGGYYGVVYTVGVPAFGGYGYRGGHGHWYGHGGFNNNGFTGGAAGYFHHGGHR